MILRSVSLSLLLCCFMAYGAVARNITLSQYSTVKSYNKITNIISAIYEDHSDNTAEEFYWTLPDDSTLRPGDNKSTGGYLATPPTENVFGGINKMFELELPGEFIDGSWFAFTASRPTRNDSNTTGAWITKVLYTPTKEDEDRPELLMTTFYTEDGSARIQIHLIGGVPKERSFIWILPNGVNLHPGQNSGPFTFIALDKVELSDGSRLYTLVVAPDGLLPYTQRFKLVIESSGWVVSYDTVFPASVGDGMTTPNKANYPRQAGILLTAALFLLSASSLTLY